MFGLFNSVKQAKIDSIVNNGVKQASNGTEYNKLTSVNSLQAINKLIEQLESIGCNSDHVLELNNTQIKLVFDNGKFKQMTIV